MDLAANLDAVRKRMEAACARAGRDSKQVTLVAITKTHPPETVAEAAKLGLNLFGESKVQEAKAKIPLCPGHLHWHLVGHLQTNKCRDAVDLFEMVHSVDSLRLAQELDRRAEQCAKRMPILLEVNLAGEASKFGYKPEQLLAELLEINRLSRLDVHGLMTVPPWSPDPEEVRPIFRQMGELRAKCEQLLGGAFTQLSMGMSGDFEVAIEEGATIVRLGTILFGERPKRVPPT